MKKWTVSIVVAVFLGTGASRSTSPHRLEVLSRGRAVWSAPIREDEAFGVAYTHSRELSRWVQHFVAQKGSLHQTESSFTAYGAGMPLGQASVTLTTAGFSVPLNQVLDELEMMNSRASSIELLYRGQRLNLSQLFADFDSFSVRVQ